MLTRLKQHLKDASYWSDCIVVISKDNLLNKAHVKFLENKFYGLAKAAGRSVVINNTIPTCSSISEYDEAMLLEFISNAKLLVNTLGYKIFDTIEDSSIKQKDDQILFCLSNPQKPSIFQGFTPVFRSNLICLPLFLPLRAETRATFYSPPTTLSSSLAEVRFASLVE